MTEQNSGSGQHDGELQQKMEALEQERAEFLKLKQQLEMEFNQKRARFKELYMSKEEELRRQALSLEEAQSALAQAQEEMENIKAVATVSESTKQEAIDQVRLLWQEEVASLQAIMKDTMCEYDMQFHQRLETERAQWSREMAELRRRLTEGQEEENLEEEMKKAQEDAEKLRSVVMPMEQEISALKSKLGSAEERVKELEAAKVKELNHVLEAEKSCRTDLEMYVAVLNTQKSVLQEDAEKLRKELHEVCHLLDLERQQHSQLKQTWQRANDQFLESQRLLMGDLQRLESVLSSEQLRQVEEMKRKDQEEEEKGRLGHAKELEEEEGGNTTGSVDDLELSTEPADHSAHGSVHSLDVPAAVSGSPDPYWDSLRRVQSTDSLGSGPQMSLGDYRASRLADKAKSASHLDESDFGPLVSADMALSGATAAAEDFAGDTILTSTPQPGATGNFLLTKDQEKAIKAMTPEQEETASLLSSISHAPEEDAAPPLGYRLVSDSEWNLLQKEVKNAGRKLGRRCDMCSNYEKQLQVIQRQEADTREQVKKLQLMVRQANQELERVTSEKTQLQEQCHHGNQEMAAKILQLVQRVQESEEILVSLQEAFSQAKRSTQEHMGALVRCRERAGEELSRVQRDMEALQGKRRLHQALQDQETFTMPTHCQELQELVSHLRGEVLEARAAGEHQEEKLQAEVLFLRERNRAEQCLKENLEETLQLEIERCKEELASFSGLKQELDQMRAEKEQLERCLGESQGATAELQSQLQEASTAKEALESQVQEDRGKAQRLQAELDVSEAVQKDFVKLSQTLQVQLERVRQAESLERVRLILNDTKLNDISQLPDT